MAAPASRVLVTDAAQRVALEVVRCLGRAGHTVVAVESHEPRRIPTFSSRYCDSSATAAGDEPFDEFLLRCAEDVDVVIPISTNNVIRVAARLEEFRARCAVLVPPIETVRTVVGKAAIIAAARDAGVPVPGTARPESLDDVATAAQPLGFPVVVKLADDEGLYLAPKERYGFARTPEELRTLWRALDRIKPRPVVQELIEGPGIGFSTVVGRDGQCLGSISHERLREHPITGGPSTCCVSMHDPVLTEQSLRLLRAVGWVGPAMVEYKRDRRDGTYRLLEVNPRFWGSVPLARLSGLNLPAALVANAVDGSVPQATMAKTGVKMRILPKDILAGAGYLASGRLAEFGGFARDLFDPRVKPGLFDSTDPKPAFLFF